VGPVAEIFTKPKSTAARRLVYPEGEAASGIEDMKSKNLIRVVFKGN
jgi:hypothetical protein